MPAKPSTAPPPKNPWLKDIWPKVVYRPDLTSKAKWMVDCRRNRKGRRLFFVDEATAQMKAGEIRLDQTNTLPPILSERQIRLFYEAQVCADMLGDVSLYKAVAQYLKGENPPIKTTKEQQAHTEILATFSELQIASGLNAEAFLKQFLNQDLIVRKPSTKATR